MFKNWLNSGSQKGYNSYGNGSAMRVSYIGWHFDTLEAVEGQAARSSTCTHDHPEGIRAAQATAGAVFLARTGASKRDLARYFRKRFLYRSASPWRSTAPLANLTIRPWAPCPWPSGAFGVRGLGELHPQRVQRGVRHRHRGCIAGASPKPFTVAPVLTRTPCSGGISSSPTSRGYSIPFLYQWATKRPQDLEDGKGGSA